MKKLGQHLIVEYYGCNQNILDNIDYIKEHMIIAAEKAGATVVGDVFHQFSPVGVSGAVVLAESHFSIHTWPEHGYAAMDFFTCGDHCDPYHGFNYLKDMLQAGKEKVTQLDRGISEE